MNEWKELKIDDLPRSIFKDNLYDFKIKTIRKERNKKKGYDESWDNHDVDIDVYGVLKAMTEEKPNLKGFYRKLQPEKKQPSHEEIMTKWWRCGDGRWRKVSCYDGMYSIGDFSYLAENFIAQESADIPPEAK